MSARLLTLVLVVVAAGCDGPGDIPPADGGGLLTDVPCDPRGPTLTCAAPVTIECSGARTNVTLAPARWVEACSTGMLPAPTNDAPSGGYPVGATTVTASGSGASCTTRVEVTDETEPTIDCPTASVRVVRADETTPIGTFAARPATDACDETVTLALEGDPPTGPGTFTLTSTATDDAGNVARCTFTAVVVDLFAPSDLRVVSAELATDGSTDTTLAWLAPTGTAVTEVALERADTPSGPFVELMRLPVATSTYTDAAMPSPQASYRVVSLGAGAERGGASNVVTAHAVARAGYTVAGAAVPGVPFAADLVGVVRHPVDLDAGPYPLVLFLHGNHGNCRPATGDDDCQERTGDACTRAGFTTVPNADGYVYLEETLAAQGYVAVSISANALNCRDDFIAERTALILEHLRRWAGGTLPLDAAVLDAADTMRTALVGHSRGGEAVSQAPSRLAVAPIAGVALAGVLSIGATDYDDNTPSGVPYLALLPGCDADVADLQAAEMVDRAAAALDGEVKAHVLLVGANHNYFNTEWRDDDDGRGMVCGSAARIGGAAQRGALEALLGVWLDVAVHGADVPAWLRNEEGSPAWMDAWAGTDLDLRTSYFSPNRVVVDDFTGSLTSDSLGEPVSITGYTAAPTCTTTCAANYAHLAPSVRLAWDGAMARASFGAGDLDASSYTTVSVRLASRAATINDAVVAHDLVVRVRDTSGGSAEALLSSLGEHGGLRHLYPARDPREVLETFRLPLASLEAVDLTSLSSIELEMPAPGHPRGSIWVSSVELAGE